VSQESPKGGAAAPGAVWAGALRGVRDNAIAEVAMQLIKLGGFVVLARALMPSDFGIFRVTVAIASFLGPFAAAGLGDTLVQREIVAADLEATCFWIATCAGIAVVSLLWLASPIVAAAMRMPALSWSLRLVALPILLDTLSTVSAVRLRRELRFGPLAAADVAAEAAFFGVAIGALLFGRPRAALALGLGARLSVHGIFVYAARPFAPPLRFRFAADRSLMRFSSNVIGGQALRTLSANADFMMVGWLLGSTKLGFYSMAWDLLRFVPDRVYAVMGRVALPAFCRLQHNDAAIRDGYRSIIVYTARLVIPMAACGALAAPEIVAAVYGPAWAGTVMPLRLLSFGLAMIGLRMIVGSIYYAKNHPALEILLQGARAIAVTATVGALAATGLFGVSLGMSLLEGAITLGGHALVCGLIGLSFLSLFRDMAAGARLALWCSAATLAAKWLAHLANLEGALALPIIVVAPALTFAWLEAETAGRLAGTIFPSRALRAET
jgi:O-antigen/teichoic acid export membrane protein